MLLVSTSATVVPDGNRLGLERLDVTPVASAICVTFADELLELVVLRDEVGLRIDLDRGTLGAGGGDADRPSAAVRLDFFSAAARPLVRSQSSAASMSPAVSLSAFLQSIMPAPLFSRRSLTIAAVTSAMLHIPCSECFTGEAGRRPTPPA